MEYGYARVSTREQNAERQLIALTGFGIAESAIFVDKQSGKDFERICPMTEICKKTGVK